VILVLGYRATISDSDYTQSARIIARFKQENPDVRFVYLASELNQHRFNELSTVDPTFPDVTIASPDNNVHTVVAEVLSSISSIPGRIMGVYCAGVGGQDRPGFEDYVTPGFPMRYRIHTIFLDTRADITLKVRK